MNNELHNPMRGCTPMEPYTPETINHHLHHHHHGGHDLVHQQRRLKTIFIRKDQMLDDIAMQIDIIADSRSNEAGTPPPALSNATEKYQSQFTRWIDKYLDSVKSRMAAYVMTIERHAVMNAQRNWDEAVIHLAFPVSWNETTFTNLADAIHQYIVNSVLKEFFVLTLTSKDPVTIDKATMADESFSQIKHCCVTQRPGFAKKTLEPF